MLYSDCVNVRNFGASFGMFQPSSLWACFYSLQIATMKKTTTIRGDVFTFKKMQPLKNGKSSIFDLYKTPGETNRKAFEEWDKKLACIYGLCGGSHSFSIYGDVIDENGERHAVKITKQNNYIID